MEIIDMINAKLRAAGMSGAELARRIGVSTGVYSQWRKGRAWLLPCPSFLSFLLPNSKPIYFKERIDAPFCSHVIASLIRDWL